VPHALEDRPDGPWLSPTAPRTLNNGDEAWRTGGALDEFTPIYLALARPTARHGAISPAEADAMDLSLIAALMGVGEAQQQQTQAWDRFAVTPAVPMVKKSRTPTTT
jgi:hypothetical protein